VPVTENITVLFTDLVGSTELASSLAPEAADDLRRSHFSALRQAIAASGGTEVKNLGDGIMVVFATASAALACAVAMQQAVDRDNRSAGRSLSLVSA
jgi:class 3 adenylate cyclase